MKRGLKRIFNAIAIFTLFLPSFVSLHATSPWSSTPVTLSAEGVAASGQNIAMDAMGNATAVWLQSGYVLSNSLPYAGAWEKANVVISEEGASEPQVVVDPNGNATALWVEKGVVMSSAKPFGKTWSSAVTLSGASASSPRLSVDQTGNIVAIWVERGFIKSSTQLFGQDWQEIADTLSSDIGSFPQISIGSGGQAVAVWQQDVSSVSTVFSASKPIGGSWGLAQSLSSNSVNSSYPQVAVDASGNAIAAWFSYTQQGQFFSKVILQATYCSFGGTWESPYSFYGSGLRDPAQLVLEVHFDELGNALLLWSNSLNGSTLDINTSSKFPGGVWTGVYPLALQDPLAYSAAAAAFSDVGMVVWMGYDPTTNLLTLQSSGRGLDTNRLIWLYPANVTAEGQIGYPSVAARQVGGVYYAVVLWLNCVNATNTLQANNAILPTLQPVGNLSAVPGVFDFRIVQCYYNWITWTPSPSTSVVRYRVMRNGFLIAEVGTGTVGVLDCNQPPGSHPVYTVFACNSFGDQSSVATIIGP